MNGDSMPMPAGAPARDFPLAPLPRSAWLFLVVLAVAVVVVALVMPQRQALPAPVWLVAPFFIALLTVGLLLALRRRRIAIEGSATGSEELVVAATFYTRRVAVGALDLDKARIADLDERTEYRPLLKTNGFGLPGFQAGHYRLRNRSKAFCLLTDRRRVLILPQPGGSLLLLSPEQPQALLDALRSARI